MAEPTNLIAVINAMPDAICLLDNNNIIQMVNDKMVNLYGLSENQIIGRHCWEIVHNQSTQPSCCPCYDMLKNGNSATQAISINNKFYDVNVTPIKDVHGKHCQTLHIIRDVTDNKNSQDLLRNNEELLKRSERVTKIGHYIFDLKTGHWSSSDMFDTIFGIDNSYVKTADGWKDILHPDDKESIFNYFIKHVVENKNKFDKEYRIIRKSDGAVRWVHGLGDFECNEDGSVAKMFGTVQDITEIKQYMFKLEESEIKFKTYLEKSPTGICIVDTQGNYKYANRAVEKLFGYTSQELLGLSIKDVLSPLHLESALQAFGQLLSTSEMSGEFKIIRKDNTIGDVIIQAVKIDENTFIGFHTDITMQKETQQKLLESESLFRSFSEQSLMGIAVVQNFQIKYINSICAEILGYSSEELFKVDFKELLPEIIHPDDISFVGKQLSLKMDGKTQGVVNQYMCRAYKKDGTLIYIENYAKTINYKGAPADLIMITDITARKHAEENLIQSEKMRAIGKLAGGIAHDFNNQLSGIVGYADLMLDEVQQQPNLKKGIEQILITSKRASDLTSRLLAFARKGMYQNALIDVHHTIHDVVSILSHTIDKNITVKELFNAQHPIIQGDPTLIQNMVMNIALNARDAMPDGGEMLLETSIIELDTDYCKQNSFTIKPGSYVLVTVTDNGCGMDRDTLNQIFEPFFTTKKPGKGTGLGLASVYGTVVSHGGAVNVYSELGHGTSFEIYLPQDIQNVEEPEIRKDIKTNHGNAHILLVDDEEIALDVTSSMLHKMGYHVSTCKDGSEALSFYKNYWETIDVVILDMVMPIMGGKETFVEMKKINPDIKVILASGYSLNGEAQSILDNGARDYIQKPFRKRELYERISCVLNTQSGRIVKQ